MPGRIEAMTEPFPSRISYAEALAIATRVAASRRLPAEQVVLSRAHGRVLARDVVATRFLPPFDNAAMDGFALRHADLPASGEAVLRLYGEQFAGGTPAPGPGPGGCVRITTGAPMPPGTDTVVIRENTMEEDGSVRLLQLPRAGQNVRLKGEALRPGDPLL